MGRARIETQSLTRLPLVLGVDVRPRGNGRPRDPRRAGEDAAAGRIKEASPGRGPKAWWEVLQPGTPGGSATLSGRWGRPRGGLAVGRGRRRAIPPPASGPPTPRARLSAVQHRPARDRSLRARRPPGRTEDAARSGPPLRSPSAPARPTALGPALLSASVGAQSSRPREPPGRRRTPRPRRPRARRPARGAQRRAAAVWGWAARLCEGVLGGSARCSWRWWPRGPPRAPTTSTHSAPCASRGPPVRSSATRCWSTSTTTRAGECPRGPATPARQPPPPSVYPAGRRCLFRPPPRRCPEGEIEMSRRRAAWPRTTGGQDAGRRSLVPPTSRWAPGVGGGRASASRRSQPGVRGESRESGPLGLPAGRGLALSVVKKLGSSAPEGPPPNAPGPGRDRALKMQTP